MTLVIGTRPEAIKLAPVARALTNRSIPARIVLTGQHPNLKPDDYGLDCCSLIELGCRGVPDPFVHAGLVARNIAPIVEQSALVVVQGDTSSALGGALGAAQAGVPVAHVEAGLRSHDRANPWPEEDFRVAIDAHADLLFAPTRLSVANLRRERLSGEVMVTGNTGIDALMELLPFLHPRRLEKDGAPRLLVTCHRRESWGEGLQAIASCLVDLAERGIARITLVLHPNPVVTSEMCRLLAGRENIELRDPCGHLEMLQLMRDSDLVLSDSGGMQEEAPVLGVPLLVLRDRTERPEAIATGNILLVGRDPERIRSAVEALVGDDRALKRMRTPALPHGDGRAAERIAAAIDDWLGRNVGRNRRTFDHGRAHEGAGNRITSVNAVNG